MFKKKKKNTKEEKDLFVTATYIIKKIIRNNFSFNVFAFLAAELGQLWCLIGQRYKTLAWA